MIAITAISGLSAPSLSAFDTASTVIVSVAAAGFLFQILQVMRYRQQKSWVRAAGFALSNAEEGQELNIAVPSLSEAGRRLTAVSRMAEKGQVPRLSDLNDAVVLRDESTFPARISRFVISVLLILGLAGTLWAFRQVLGDPQLFDLEGRLDMSRLSDYVNQVYAGLSHAFGASLCGIVCTAVLLLSRTTWVQSERSSFFAALDDFTENELIPKLVKAPPTLPQALRETSIHMETATTKLLEVGNALKDTVTEANSSAAILERFASTLLNAGTKFETILAGGSPVEKMLGQLNEAVVRQEAILEQFQLFAKHDRKDLLDAIGGVQSLGAALREWLGEIHELVADHQASTHAIKNAAGTLSESAQGVFETVAQDAESREQLRAALNKELSTALTKWDAAGRDVRKLIDALHTASDRHYEMITSLGRTLGSEAEKQRMATEGVSTALNGLTARLAPLPQLVSSELSPLIASIEHTLSAQAAQQRAAIEALTSSLSASGHNADSTKSEPTDPVPGLPQNPLFPSSHRDEAPPIPLAHPPPVPSSAHSYSLFRNAYPNNVDPNAQTQ